MSPHCSYGSRLQRVFHYTLFSMGISLLHKGVVNHQNAFFPLIIHAMETEFKCVCACVCVRVCIWVPIWNEWGYIYCNQVTSLRNTMETAQVSMVWLTIKNILGWTTPFNGQLHKHSCIVVKKNNGSSYFVFICFREKKESGINPGRAIDPGRAIQFQR